MGRKQKVDIHNVWALREGMRELPKKILVKSIEVNGSSFFIYVSVVDGEQECKGSPLRVFEDKIFFAHYVYHSAYLKERRVKYPNPSKEREVVALQKFKGRRRTTKKERAIMERYNKRLKAFLAVSEMIACMRIRMALQEARIQNNKTQKVMS